MMARTQYNNGDPIHLKCGCNGCSPLMINQVLTHEPGCPDAWRDCEIECQECGFDFLRQESKYERVCPDCIQNHEEAMEEALADTD